MITRHKPVSKGWTRLLKTFKAQHAVQQGAATAHFGKITLSVFRDALRQKTVGTHPEHLGLAPLNRSLRGTTAWWAASHRHR